MVNARLHIICGNCGENKMFSYEIYDDIDNAAEGEKPKQGVWLKCKNCATLHDLDSHLERMEE